MELLRSAFHFRRIFSECCSDCQAGYLLHRLQLCILSLLAEAPIGHFLKFRLYFPELPPQVRVNQLRILIQEHILLRLPVPFRRSFHELLLPVVLNL